MKWTAGTGAGRATVTRRTFTALGAAGLLAACGGGGDEQAGGASGGGGAAGEALQFWGWVPGLEDLVATWNSANPDALVEFHRMTGDDGQKVEAAVDAGAGPDVVQLSTHQLPDYVINQRVQAITDFVTEDEDLYTASSWKSVTVGGEVYGLPQGSGPTAMMYREDILAQHGIAVPTTHEEYEAAAAALHAADPEVYLAGFSPSEIGQWVQDVSQAGGSYFDVRGQAWDVVVDSPASREVAARWQRLLDAGLLKVTEMWTPDYWAAVNAGQIATITYAAWFPVQLIENCADLAGRWRVAPQPAGANGRVSGDSGGAANIVLAGAQDLDRATRFIRWLNGDPASVTRLISDGGIFPTAKSGFEDPALAQTFPYFGGQAIYDVYREAADTAPTTWTDGPANGQVDSDLTDGFGEVATGGTTFTQVLTEADAAAVARLRKAGLDVVEG